jgi:hypothetical protein
MKVAETNRFETGNKRVIRNPNQYTPIDLVYFKLMQKLEVAHERYGVRLCWAPFIPDPGIVLDQAEAATRTALEQQTPLDLPTLRSMPQPPGAPPPETVNCGTQELASWGSPWGDMRADYWFEILPSATNYQWDGVSSSISSSIMVSTTGFGRRGPPNVALVRAESFIEPDSGKRGCRVLIHAGADWGGPGAHLYIDFNVIFVPNVAPTRHTPTRAMERREGGHDAEVAHRRSQGGDHAAAAAACRIHAHIDPVATAYQLVAKMFRPRARDEGFEVVMWNDLDFEATAFHYLCGE